MDKSVQEYINKFPQEVQKILLEINDLIKKTVPNAEEVMGYGVPAFKLKGKYLVYYAAFKKHVGLYPSPEVIKYFKEELSGYETAKGTIKFPLDKKMPYNLIKKIVKFKAKEIEKEIL